jgi:hypothetical protein
VTIGVTQQLAGARRRAGSSTGAPRIRPSGSTPAATSPAAYLAFIAFYLVCVAVTGTVYLRPGRRLQDV